MKNKIYSFVSILVFTLLIVSFVSASQQSMEPQKQYASVLISQSGDVNGVPFSSCNITSIRINNGTNIISPAAMTYANDEFTYLLNSGLTSKLGTYVARGSCDGYTWVFDFEVTTTGGKMNLSLWVSLMLLLVSLTIFIISVVSDNQYIGFLGGVGFIVSGLYTMVYGLGSLSDMYTRTISIIIIAFGLIVFFISSFYHEASDTGLGQYFGISKPEVDKTDYFNEEYD